MTNRYDFIADPAGKRQRYNFGATSPAATIRSRYDFSSESLQQKPTTREPQPAQQTQEAQRTAAIPTRTPSQGALRTTTRFFDSMLHGATLGAFPAPEPAETTGERVADILGKVGGFVVPVIGAKKTGGGLAVRGLRRLAPKAGAVPTAAAEGAGIGATIAAAEGVIQDRHVGEIAKHALAAGTIGGVADAAITAVLPRVFRPFIRKAGQATQPTPATTPSGVAAMVTQTQPVAKAPTAGQTQATGITKRKEIVNFLSEKLDIPIRVGRYHSYRKGGKAVGIFKQKPEVIRTLQAEDISTISHEVGHYLDKTLGLQKTAFDSELLTIGQATSPAHYTQDRIRAEGVAEFMRLYLTDTAQAKAKAPGYFREFEARIAQTSPETLDILAQARQDIHNWKTQPAKARVLGSISVGARQPRKLSLDRLYSAAVNEQHMIEKAVRNITGGAEIPIGEDPARLAWLNRGWTGIAKTFLHHGVVDENFTKIGKSFDEILRPVANRLDDFRAYITARRASELHGRNITTGIAQTDVNEVLRTLQSPEFDRAFAELVEFQRSVLLQLVETGVISPKTAIAMAMKNQQYVPFYRLFDEAADWGAGKAGFGNLRSPVKRIKGSTRTIIDPLESIIKNTYVMTNIAERNRVGKALVNLAERFEGAGKWVEKVKAPVRGTKFQLDEIAKELEQAGVDVDNIDLEQVASIFRPSIFAPGKENILTIFRNGKAEFFQLEPELYRAMLSLDRESSSMLINMLSYPARMLRAGATLTPEFMVRNPIRDQFSAFINSKYGFIPVVDFARGLFIALRKDDLYWRWHAAGGAHGSMVSLDRDYLQGSLRGLLRRSLLDKTLNIVTQPLEVLRAFSEFTEHATRLGEFVRGIKKEGLTPAGQRLAALASRDITLDFSRIGTATKPMNRITAFFNAQVQGMDKMARVWRDNPGRATLRAMTSITLPSVILYSINRNDPRYQELPQWQKDLFWIIPTENTLYRIPKPFELGVLFGTLPERILTWIDQQDPRALDGLSSRLLSGFTPNVLPTALVPVIESFANRSMFTNLPIVPRREEKLLADYQYGPETPEIAKKIGQALDVSPRHVQNVIRGYTGGLGRYAMDIADAGLEATGVVGPVPRPTKELADLPVARAFVARTYGPGAPSIERLYADMDSLERRHQSGHTLTAQETTLLARYRQATKQLTWYRGQMRQIMEAPGMTPEAKRAAVDYLNLAMINTARQAQGLPPLTRD